MWLSHLNVTHSTFIYYIDLNININSRHAVAKQNRNIWNPTHKSGKFFFFFFNKPDSNAKRPPFVCSSCISFAFPSRVPALRLLGVLSVLIISVGKNICLQRHKMKLLLFLTCYSLPASVTARILSYGQKLRDCMTENCSKHELETLWGAARQRETCSVSQRTV